MRTAISLLCALMLVVVAQADDKEIKLDGSLCCAKCELKKADNCNAVLIVKEGDKEVMYYFDEASQKKFGEECCKEKKTAKVTGTMTEKDGKKWITVTKVEYVKKD